MKPLWTIFGLLCHKDSRWVMAASATRYVQRQAYVVHKSDRDDPQVNRNNPATRKTRRILDFEQVGMRQMMDRKSIAKLTPLIAGNKWLDRYTE
jgi:hypothetical protein